MTWFKQAPKFIGISALQKEVLHVAIFRADRDGSAHLAKKKEFMANGTMVAETKKELAAFLTGFPKNLPFRHIVQRDRAFTKQFQFPSRSALEIKQMLKLRLPREIPSALEEIVFHFHPIGEEADPAKVQTTVLLFGVSKEAVNQEREALKSYGIHPRQVILSTVALSFALADSEKAMAAPTLMLYGIGGKGEAILLSRGVIQFSRSFSYDPSEMHLTVQQGVTPVFQTLESEMEIKSCSLYIAGELESMEGAWFGSRTFVNADIKTSQLQWAPIDFLLNSAARGSWEKCEEFNLVPEEVKRTIEFSKSRQSWSDLRAALTMCVFALLLCFTVLSLRTAVAISVLNRKLTQIEPSVKVTKEVARKVKALRMLQVRKVKPIDLFVSAHQEASGDIRLGEFEYVEKEAQVRLKGAASSQSSIDQYVRSLAGIPWLSRAELQYSESVQGALETQLQFSIRATIKKDG